MEIVLFALIIVLVLQVMIYRKVKAIEEVFFLPKGIRKVTEEISESSSEGWVIEVYDPDDEELYRKERKDEKEREKQGE